MKNNLKTLLEERMSIDTQLKWETSNVTVTILNEKLVFAKKNFRNSSEDVLEIKGDDLKKFYDWFGELLNEKEEGAQAEVVKLKV